MTDRNKQLPLRWLEEVPPLPSGVTWGVPWHRGELHRSNVSALMLTAPDGSPVQLQSWPTAYWPDGSVKWTAHAASLEQPQAGAYGVQLGGAAGSGAAAAVAADTGGAAASPAAASAAGTSGTATAGANAGAVAAAAGAAAGTTTAADLAADASGTATAEADAVAAAACAAAGTDAGRVAAPACLSAAGAGRSAAAGITVTESEDEVTVDTGALRCVVGRRGAAFIRALHRGGQQRRAAGTLVCIREERQEAPGGMLRREEAFQGEVTSVTVEQAGPVRAVLLAEGVHRAQEGGREWLPFRLRLYLYANQASLRIVHTFLYDGDPQHDYVKGLGITFALPLTGPLYNRYARFAGDSGMFAEAVRHLSTRRTTGEYVDLFRRQQAGEPIAFDPDPAADGKFAALLESSAAWDSFKLTQLSADSYSIVKRTNRQSSWVKAAQGNRAGGLVYAGDANGGLAAGMRHCWQKYPSAQEATGLTGGEAKLTLWFWSPDAAAMDMRHYDTATHVEAAYEGAEELRSTPYGIANTNEVQLWVCERTPSAAELAAMARHVQAPPLLICEPQRYYETNVFGVWSLPDRSTSAKAWIEEQLDAQLRFYCLEAEQRRWYGFWDYGDFMHTYDQVRHSWRYDVGGFAWQNTELVPNMWLWLSFLRTGRSGLFRLAEAMTRHTSEVDVYHFGEYAGLGSRHNVVHWGCGCKEARIAMAGLHRYYYFLTADERLGEVMAEVANADYATVQIDPMRAYFPPDEHPTHARTGPDWSAFCSNWMSQWERFESGYYRDKLLRGIEDLKAAPLRLLSGTTFGYDPAAGSLTHIGDSNYDYHMVVAFGAPQVWMELSQLLADPVWDDMLAEFGEFYYLPPEEKLARTNGALQPGKFALPMLAAAMAAYAANRRSKAQLAAETWRILLENRLPGGSEDATRPQPVPELEYVRPIEELPRLSTNNASQWSLNAIIALELIGSALPARLPARLPAQLPEQPAVQPAVHPANPGAN